MSQERIDDSSETPWWGEHENRYDEALKYLGSGLTVLDIACGTGFGTFKLFKDGQNNVTGGDISDEALRYCQEKYRSYLTDGRLVFERLDATALKFADGAFDVIVSFETIEHIADYKKVIAEYYRVLKPNGIFILSTPNRFVSSPTGKILNPFHVQEFSYDELKGLLTPWFSDCQIGGQEYIRYKNGRAGLARVVERIFYQRGVRRLSVSFRDRVMRMLGQLRFYPISADYTITYEMKDLLKCLTFFVVCKK